MEEKNKQDIKKERRMPMKPGFSNISSMPLIECFFPSSVFHHSVDVLLLFSSVHSSIHNSNRKNTLHLFSWLFVFVVAWIPCTKFHVYTGQ